MTADREDQRDLVLLGGSAGAIEVLPRILGGLPADLRAAVLVVVHTSAHDPSGLVRVLSRSGPLPVSAAENEAPIEPGHVYVAVPGRHLLVRDGMMLVSAGPKQNRVRPSVDALFRSAARWRGPRAVAVQLSGSLDDGAVGLAAVSTAGGACIVQDPDDARHSGMPRAALAVVPDAKTLPGRDIAAGIQALLSERVEPSRFRPDADLITETDMAEKFTKGLTDRRPGRPAALSCPDCTGGMNVVETGGVVHYTCHTGHIWSPQTLLEAQQDKVEGALWTALSILEEQARVFDVLAGSHNDPATGVAGRHQRAAAEEVRKAAEVIRKHFPDIVLDR
ncbi:chemotaxis protein CheB [Actinoplanes sp. TRM 88003]|uniref:protein-glutamate methylesterase n=1 Tax=Paractinoplanes aksuensis TaxID=2939490 RepID=A0ABT1E196_9ACTN|nr:chemotaxis protein CheB [Actinoplanes aksuensis]MCO8276882.1 chemotaxis protein CheB [Actinoplanes aksuensis]